MSGTLQTTIPSYSYAQYADDENIQSFIAAFNAITQQYINTFNALNLPNYTGSLIVGALLDWVARGLYGMPRPLLPAGITKSFGAYNTSAYNTLCFNESITLAPTIAYITTDDIFKRVLTWHLFKGDGKVFNVRWLKRRIMRFLVGVDGTNPNIDNTDQISVTFGVNGQVTIRIIDSQRSVSAGAIYNTFAFNAQPYNGLSTFVTQYPTLVAAPILQAAVASGALELPFQFSWLVIIVGGTLLSANGGFLLVDASARYPTSSAGLLPGALWSNSTFVSVVPGSTPSPTAPPVIFSSITAQQLLALGGGNLPITDPLVLGQLWNNGGFVCISNG